MKQEIFTNKFKSLLVIAFALLFGQGVWAYDIVSYSLTGNLTSTSVDVSANAGKTFIGSAGAITFTSSVAQNSGWNVANQYWQTAPFSTVGYHTIGISASMRSDNNAGPRDFNLEYSIDNGASWHLVNSFTVSSSLLPKTGTLPQECQNQSSVIVRWINTSNSAVGTGTVTAVGKSYIKTVSIGGLLPVIPATQAHDLTVVSRTPTTITVGWTKGVQADSVVVMMNTTNSFTPLPVDNQNFTAMTGTYTSGRQVIYVGTKSTFTVNVPSATDQYYFRAFDFQTNNGMSRYILTSSDNDPVVLNPILCDLEIITLNASTFRLTRATLGATIQAPKKSTIYEKGIFWSYSPGVSEADNPLQDFNDLDGSFSFPNEVIGRAVTIYYKGYATNESGTIWTAEAILNNSPIFTGSGTWETAALWNVQEVPGANGDATYGNILDSPTINGICSLTASNSVTNLTINSTKKLSIDAATTLTVAGTLTNSATTGLVVKAGNGTTANASLIFSNKALNQNVPASVEMYSIASTVGGNHWQYFGVPVQSQTVGTTFGGSERVRRFNEANFDPTGNDYGLWYPYPVSTMAGSETLSPVVGYEVVQSLAKTYTFKGNLNASDFNHTLAFTTVPQLADYAGQNIIANPYTAAINIQTLLTNNPGLDDAAVYIYNTGSREEWELNSGLSTPGSNPGTYSVSTGGFAGIFGVPAQIPSMQGFLMKTNSSKTLNIPYSSVVTNNKPQRAPALDQKVATMIDVIGSKSSDRMWIFSEPTCTRNFDNGFDGRKILGYNTQLFAMEGSEDYQIDAVYDINNTYLGFQSGSETNFKLKFTHQNLEDKYSSIYLVDLVKDTTINITASGTEYAFTAVPSTTPSQRFKITTSTAITTDNVTPNANEQIKIYGSQGNAVVQNLSNAQGDVYIYTMAGQFVRNVPFSANGVTTISNLKAGAYIVKAKTAANEVNSCLIIR